MARGVPCLSWGGSLFALLVLCVHNCLWGWGLLSHVSLARYWVHVQLCRLCALPSSKDSCSAVPISGNIHRGYVCVRTYLGIYMSAPPLRTFRGVVCCFLTESLP